MHKPVITMAHFPALAGTPRYDLGLGIEGILEKVREDVKHLLAGGLVNTGARIDNICGFLAMADGVIVGSSLKVDGYTWNPVDPERVRAFMAAVREARSA